MSLSPSATVDEKGIVPHTTTQTTPPPHIRPAEDILIEHGVDIQAGLSNERAASLLAENGPNQIKPPQPPSKLKILLAQMTNAMTIVLLGAMAVSLGTEDWIAAGVIGALVFLNVSVGFTRTCPLLFLFLFTTSSSDVVF
jgi:P-type Na+/K+ transporter